MIVSTATVSSLSPATSASPEWSSSIKASTDAYFASSPPDVQSTSASVMPETSSSMATVMTSSSIPGKPMPSGPLPVEPVPTLPPIAVDPVPTQPPMPIETMMPSPPAPIAPTIVPSAPAPAPPALATTTSNSPDQALVVIEFFPIVVQPTNVLSESETDCEESEDMTPEPESCTDAVDVPFIVPMTSPPKPIDTMTGMPVLPMPSPLMSIEAMITTPVPVLPMPPAPTSLAPLPPPMVTPVYQTTPVAAIENSVSPSSEAPVIFTGIKISTDDVNTEFFTIPFCDEEVMPTLIPTNVPALPVPTPMPEPTTAPVAPVPAPMPTTAPVMPVVPAVPAPAPSSQVGSESETAATCTPEFITVTIYDEMPVDPVTVTEYVPYFLPVDTDMWTDLFPTPPLEPGPIVWTGAPPPLATNVPTAAQPVIPAPSSSHAPCPTSSWVQV
ncbi:hypothetical protein GGI19_002248 [Coemansia pectinata]|uniref:Uncharacterized protein n=1 Tax=Coemansia pectinata TaxID=1052879 RepID=A0A9W8H019_9FUNG|nr:hypothetical protein GGI19_002248 [Coemansia pectinata]